MVRIKGNQANWNPKCEIKDLGDFIIKNPRYLSPFHSYMSQYKAKDELAQTALLELLLEENDLINGQMDRALDAQFTKLLVKFIECDEKAQGNARGDLLEYICYVIGPFLLTINEKVATKLRQCTLVDELGQTICGDHNIDLGFRGFPESMIELLECKWKLGNFLDESSETKRKLDYMKCIGENLDCRKHTAPNSLAFVTMQNSTFAERQKLARWGYEIPILNLVDIVQLMDPHTLTRLS